eukprot:scaffold53707_cov17-Prasinocladus_malaysianus.AAC.1
MARLALQCPIAPQLQPSETILLGGCYRKAEKDITLNLSSLKLQIGLPNYRTNERVKHIDSMQDSS